MHARYIIYNYLFSEDNNQGSLMNNNAETERMDVTNINNDNIEINVHSNWYEKLNWATVSVDENVS